MVNIRQIMSRATKAVEFMYDKRMNVERNSPYKKPNGTWGERLETVIEGAPCRLSKVKLDNSGVSGASLNFHYAEMLFTSAQHELLAGDVITIDGTEYLFAQDPKVYVSHQEVYLTKKGTA